MAPKPDNRGREDVAEKKRLVAAALAAGATQIAAAEAGQVTDRTVRRWLAEDPAFGELVKAERSQLIGRAAGRLAGLVDHAADALKAVLTDSGNAASRVSAARCVFDSLIRTVDQFELQEQIRELQRLAGIRSPGAE